MAKFTAWELLALETSLEKAIKRGEVNPESGKSLLEKLRNLYND